MKAMVLPVLLGLSFMLGCGGGGASAPPPPPPPATPSISSLSPASVLAGGQSFTLTITGKGFASGSVVGFGGVTHTTTSASSTQLTTIVTPDEIASAETIQVTVSNPSASGDLVSNPASFTVNNPQPAITSLSPSHIQAGAAALPLGVTGSNFVVGSVVNWNGSPRATTFSSGSGLQAAITASDLATQGTAAVTVVNPAPAVGPSSQLTFTIDPFTSNPAPSLTSLHDVIAPVGWPGFDLIVDGADFVPASVAEWNGAARPTDVLTTTQLKAAISLSDLANAGSFPVSVSSPAPGGGLSNTLNFTVAPPVPGIPTMVDRSSVANDLTEGNETSFAPVISTDGRFVAFLSYATNLTSPATSGTSEAYLRDTCRGAPAGCTPSVTLVSIASDGTPADGYVNAVSISASGRYVAFSSSASNLAPGVTSFNLNVYVRDTCFGGPAGCSPATALISSDSEQSEAPAISSDGRYVAFVNGTPGPCDYYSCDPDDWHAMLADTCVNAPAGCAPATTEISLAADGSPANDTSAFPMPQISADGRWVAFVSAATNLAAGASNGFPYVYLRDTCAAAAAGCTPSTALVSVANDGSELAAGVNDFSLSPDGRFVSFSTVSSNVVSGDSNGFEDVFVRDTCFGALACTPATTRISVATDGTEANAPSYEARISSGGEFITFVSDATNLIAGDTVPFPQVFMRDTCVGAAAGCTPSTVLLSVALDGSPGDNQSEFPALSSDARYVAFQSGADNLGPGDSNQLPDIYVVRTLVP